MKTGICRYRRRCGLFQAWDGEPSKFTYGQRIRKCQTKFPIFAIC